MKEAQNTQTDQESLSCLICELNFAAYGRLVCLTETINSSAGWGDGLVGMPYGDRSRKHRKWIYDAIGSMSALRNWHPMQRRETFILLSGLCENPEALGLHINRLVFLATHWIDNQTDPE